MGPAPVPWDFPPLHPHPRGLWGTQLEDLLSPGLPSRTRAGPKARRVGVLGRPSAKCEGPPHRALTVDPAICQSLNPETAARPARPRYRIHRAQCKMKTYGSLLNITENFETVTADHETELGALGDCTGFACAPETSTQARAVPTIEEAAEVPG